MMPRAVRPQRQPPGNTFTTAVGTRALHVTRDSCFSDRMNLL